MTEQAESSIFYVVDDVLKRLLSLEKRVSALENRSSRFIPPLPEQVAEYAKSIGFDDLNAESFVDYYEKIGWGIKGSKMKSWKAAVRTWKRTADANKPRSRAQKSHEDRLKGTIFEGLE